MSNHLEFRKQREFGEIISDTFLFIKQNFKPLLKVFFYLCGFFILASILSAVTHLINVSDVLIDSSRRPQQAFSKMFSWSYFLVILLYLITYSAITVTTLSYIAVYIQKENVPPSPEEVWTYFKYYFLRVLGSTIPITLLMIVGFICCIIPGVYIFPALSLFFAVMVLENGSFAYSFGRAFKLSHKDWWATAGAMFIIWIITYAAFLIPSLPGIILGMIIGFTQGAASISKVWLVIATVVQYLSYVFMMIPLIGVALCYFNLAERLESGGLLARIDTLGKQSTSSDTPEEY
ncbi:MAG: hypothetical protein WKF66_03180 [Pedobacter sp.]